MPLNCQLDPYFTPAEGFSFAAETCIDAETTLEQRVRLAKLSPEAVKESGLAGERITAKLTRAPGNSAAIGGLKVMTATGWFTARPSGTESIYKVYAESFRDEQHLNSILKEAQEILNNALITQ